MFKIKKAILLGLILCSFILVGVSCNQNDSSPDTDSIVNTDLSESNSNSNIENDTNSSSDISDSNTNKSENTSDTNANEKKYYITFKVDEKTIDTVNYSESSDNIVPPSVPFRAGYVGVWENFDLDNKDIIVNAIYTPIQYSVTFMAGNEAIAVEKYTVENTEISTPSIPNKIGYDSQWEKFTLNNSDITVNAIYTPIQYSVTFVINDETVAIEKYTIENKTISIPAVPQKQGYVGKWEKFALSYGDITVNAIYSEIAVWDGNACAEGFFDGNGSQEMPYLISSPAELYYLSQMVNNGNIYAGVYFQLCCDIDLGGFEWTPIGYGGGDVIKSFNGYFDGNNHLISNLKITTPQNIAYYGDYVYYSVGLFGYTANAQISNLTLKNAQINIDVGQQSRNVWMCVGTLIGNAERTLINNCIVDSNLTSKCQTTYYERCWINMGGIVGAMSGSISSSNMNGNIFADCSYARAGGICGIGTADIEYCEYEGEISGVSQISEVGGIIGESSNNNICFSVANGNLNSSGYYDAYCGGIVGTQSETAIYACSAHVFVNATSDEYVYIGGISGYLNTTTDKISNCTSDIWVDITTTANNIRYYAGGLSGYIKEGEIIESVSRGEISIHTSKQYAYAFAGGITGYIKGSSLNNKIKISNCLVDCILDASTENDLICPRIYTADFCEITNVTLSADMDIASIQEMGFELFEGEHSNLISNGKVWVWNEPFKYLSLFTENSIATSYTINVYIQGLDGEYELLESTTQNGIANSIIKPIPLPIEGFDTPKPQTVNVDEAGTTTVEYLYVRQTYIVNFIANNGQTISKTVMYKESLSLDSIATHDGYTFGGWFYETELINVFDNETMPCIAEKTLTLYAYWAGDSKPSNFEYDIYYNYACIKKYIGENKSVTVPAYIAGIKVTEISAHAFENNTNLEMVSLPKTLTKIGKEILRGCSNLEILSTPFVGLDRNGSSISTNTNYILGYFFEIQTYSNIPSSLSTVVITDSTTIPQNSFYNCINLVTVSFGSKTTTIGNNAFYNCANLSGTQASSNIVSIGNNAYYNTSVENVDFPAATQIGEYAFSSCVNLRKANFSTALSKIPNGIFYGCKRLVGFNSDNSIIISEKVTDIGWGAFADCESILSINGTTGQMLILDGMITIGNYAFRGLVNITYVDIARSVTSIGECAFEDCNSIEHMVLPFVGNNRSYSGNTYDDNTSGLFGFIFGYETVYIGVTSQTTLTTYQNTGYESVYLYMDDKDYGTVSSYDGYKIPKTLKTLEITDANGLFKNAFYNCDMIETITFTNQLYSVGTNAFYNCSATISYLNT